MIRNRDFTTDVAMGGRTGHSIFNKFGSNPDIDTGTPELIAAQGGNLSIMTTADTLDIVSDSANDTVAGTGARVLLITGIDENNLAVEETLVMNGVTPVTTTNSYLGVNRIVVVSSGSVGANDGNITADDTSDTVGVQAYVAAGSSVTEQCFIHTPISTNFLASWLWMNALKLSGGSSPRVTINGYSYSRVTSTTYEIFKASIDTSVENTLQMTPAEPFVIGGREVLYFTASTTVNGTEVSMRFSGKLIPT